MDVLGQIRDGDLIQMGIDTPLDTVNWEIPHRPNPESLVSRFALARYIGVSLPHIGFR